MSDPRMEFICHYGKFFPSYFRQDFVPQVDQESMFFLENNLKMRMKMQKEHVNFADFWLKNISDQQKFVMD